MSKILLMLFLMGLLFRPVALPAQEVKLLHYGMDEGLSSNTVYRLYKDKKGFLWIATDKGVSCFNGLKFINYNTLDGLPDNEIFFFAEDYQGRLWLGAFNGQLCYYQNGSFFNAKNKPFLKLPFKATINNFHLAKDSSITMLFEGRQFINIKDTIIRVYHTSESVELVQKKAQDEYELFSFDKRTIVDTAGIVKKTYPFTRHKAYTLATAGVINKDIFLLTQSAIYDLNENLLFRLPEPVTNHFFIPTLLIRDSTYFLCTRQGLLNNSTATILKDIPVSSVVTDINGDYWIATLGKGIYYLNKNTNDIKEYSQVYENTVTKARDFGALIRFATGNGRVYALDKKSRKHTYIGGGFDKNLPVNGDFDLHGNYLSFSGYGNQIVTSTGNISTGIKKRAYKSVLSLGHELLCSDIDEIIRVSYPDLLRRNKVNILQKYSVNKKHKERIYAVAWEPGLKELWYSSATNLYKISGGSSLLQRQFGNINFRKFGFCNNYLVGYTDKNELIICNHYNSSKPQSDTVNIRNYIWESLYPVSDSQIIVSSSNNYYLITLRPSASAPAYRIQTIENPFIPVHAEYICSDSNTFYFFKQGNITTVSRKFLMQLETPVPVVSFSCIRTAHKNYLADSAIVIPFKESRNLKVSFKTLSFYGRDITYEYCITGYLDHWQSISADELNILSLPHGHYTLKIRCKSKSSPYSNEAHLNLVIGRPYWATWWFIAAVLFTSLLVLSGLVWLIIRIIIKRKQKQYLIDLKYRQLEFKSLNALMNPHFIFNSLNNIQGLINDNNKYAANKYLVIFSDMIRQNMQNIAMERISLKKELDLIENYLKLEKLRFEHTLNYTIEVSPDLDIEKIQIPALLIQPLVENAVKHGFPGKRNADNLVRIIVEQEQDSVQILVIDNGVGLKQQYNNRNPGHTSYGLQNIMSRAEQMKQIEKRAVSFTIEEIKDDNNEVKGTKACISLDNIIYHS